MSAPSASGSDWLGRVFRILRGARVPVLEIVTTDAGLDVELLDASGQKIVVELRPRGDDGEPSYRATARHAIRYRAARELGAPSRAMLDAAVRTLATLEPLLPAELRAGERAGGKPEDPATELRRRFPFAFLERSTSEDGLDMEMLVRVTPTCNQRCPFCSAPPTENASPEALAACLDLACEHFPGVRLTITGGEPTLRAGFQRELVDALGRPQISLVQVQTNAVAFASGARAGALPRSPRLRFFVSLHATDERIYDECTGTTGQMPLALEGIKNLLGGGHQVVLNAVVSRANVAHLPDLVVSLPALFAGLPLPALHFSVLMCPDDRPGAAEYLVRYSEVAPVIEGVTARAAGLGIVCEPLVSSTHASIPLCIVAPEHRAASTHRPELAEDETRYDDFGARWVKPGSCRACVATERCLGLPTPYAQRFGFGELRPYGGSAGGGGG